MSDLPQLPVTTLQGEPTTLGELTGGRPALVVNVASRCGLTSQFAQLEALQEQYGPRGFTVIGVPSNQFGGQEPGTAEEIAEFCSTTYGVSFPMTEKVDVNGPDAHPLYRQLTEVPDTDGKAGDIAWNFEKFVLSGDGQVVGRFRPTTLPDAPEIRAAIESVLPAEEHAMSADLHFYFDPVCPFAWMTSKWVRQVAAQREYDVDWRFISLRVLNAHVDYDAHFPPEYEAGHTAGLRLLRVAARVRAEHGRAAVGPLYAAFGQAIFESEPVEGHAAAHRDTPEFVEPILLAAGLPADLADALGDESADEEIRAETAEALALTGKDVGTPILHFRPGDPSGGTAFFGPVISRLPSDEDAVALWDHVTALAAFPGFAELKRSLRERPQLPAFGVRAGETGRQEDWHAGSRRQKR